MSNSKKGFWLTANGLAALSLIGGVLYFLLSEHRAHFFYALPYLILLLCPFMHFFMHRGHGEHSDHEDHGKAHQRDGVE